MRGVTAHMPECRDAAPVAALRLSGGPRVGAAARDSRRDKVTRMPQLTLFESTETLLADDERGRIAYTPRFVDAATGQTWFAELRRDVKWRAEQRTMYDREVDVPRLVGHFRLDRPAASTPGAILDSARRVVESLGVPFNSVGLNLYRDGRDSVAPHNDHLSEIRKGFPIALVSLGATRRMPIDARGHAADRSRLET